MDSILKLDCKPYVFRVYVQAVDHTSGFSAVCEFRDNDRREKEWVVSADTPERALENLYTTLQERLGPCPHCGRKGAAI
jgi:hypothetical protein